MSEWLASDPFRTPDLTGFQNLSGLRVYLLGPPRAEWGGHALAVPRRQARALLYRLAARLQPVPREHLCFLFWPDTPESICRRNLSRLLTHLRRALPAPEVLVTSGDAVWLDAQRTWSDAVAFEQGATARGATARVAPTAVDLYRGPFLAGFSLPGCREFDMWATLEREAWERLYLEALAALIEERTASGDYVAAIAYARRYLATEELAEDVHRRLIELYAAVGDRSAALRQFERCVTALERELGVSPLPETQEAYRTVLAGETSRETRFFGKNLVSGGPVWATLPGLDVPLVGREEVLGRLKQAYAGVQVGRGGVVLISGEPGIGKSRLVQEFATRYRGQAWILTGAGFPGAQALPYEPLVQALRCSFAPLPPRPLAPLSPCSIAPVWLAEASRLMPELGALHPNLPPLLPLEPEQARARLFEALYQCMVGLAVGPHPVLLCLDDLHWADSTTLDWLAYLGRRLHGSRLLVIGTYRIEEADGVAGLRHSLARQGILSELKLVGLDGAGVLQLLQHVARTDSHRQGDEALASRLQQLTGGNPFFILETLRAFIEAGRRLEELAGLEDLPLPDSVRDAVGARVEHLSAKARQVLEAGAILGQAFTFDAVHLTAGRQEMEMADGLDELVARQLLVEQAAGYCFQHELVREVVYRGLSFWRRRLLHRRAGEALERLQSDDAAALAWQFERAEEPGRAARYALQAGQAARAIFAHVEARACFDRALALLEQEAVRLQDTEVLADNWRLRIQALYGRGWALRLLGDMEAYARDLEEVARLAERLGDGRTLAHLRWREAYTHRWFCRYAEAREAAEEGVRLSQAAADAALEAMCWREVGVAARATGDYARARVALERALSLFVDLGDAVHELHVLGNLSTLYWYMGEHERAMSLARRALARCEEAGLPLQRRLPLGDVGAAAAGAGDGDLARQCLLESLSIARQVADRTQEILCLGHLGWLYVREKQAGQALKNLRAGLALAQSIGSCCEQSWLLAGLAEAYRLLGKTDQAVAHARRALELAQASGRAYERDLARRILECLERYQT